MSSIPIDSAFPASDAELTPRPAAVPADAPRLRLRRALGWLSARWARKDEPAAPPLELELAERSVRAAGPREFEFTLAGRAEFPTTRLREMLALTPAQLERSAARIREVERELAAIVAGSLGERALFGEMFRELPVKVFSRDHDWRDIVEALMRLSPQYDEYKRIALVKYMQYLRARQRIMRSVFIAKTRGDANACVHATRALDEAPARDADQSATIGPARTRTDPDDRFRFLPKGETVRIALGAARCVELLLAGNRFRFHAGRTCYLVDDDDKIYPLAPGKNLVGRHSECDVVVDRALRSVSRRHLVVEPAGPDGVLLTDLSSHGTEYALADPRRH